MNQIRKALLIIVPLAVIISCNYEKMRELEAENSKLSTEAVLMDSTIQEYLFTIEAIEDNLSKIKEKENLIQLRAGDDLDGEEFNQVISDLEMISAYMDENKQKIIQLNERLEASGSEISKLKSILARINKQMAARDKSIALLNNQMKSLNFKNSTLQANVHALKIQSATLGNSNSKLAMEVQSQNELLEKQSLELNTAYFALGSGKDLLGKDIIIKTGGILGIGSVERLCNKLDVNNFAKIDIATTTAIPLMAKRIKLVTDHPVDSYKIESDANLYTSLVITNPERFWNVSKFLVVRVN